MTSKANSKNVVNSVNWRNKFEIAVLASKNLLYQWDSITNEVSYSGDLKGILGYEMKDMNGGLNKWRNMIHPDDLEMFDKTISHLLKTKKHVDFEYRVRKKDGTFLLVEDSGHFTNDKDGNISQMIGFIKDISKKSEIENSLIDSESKLRAIFDSSIDAIGMNLKGINIMGNPAYFELFGFESEEEMIGKSILDQISPSERGRVSEITKNRAIGSHAPQKYESKGIDTKGREFDMEVHVSTFPMGGENYTVAVLRDISERKESERALRRYALELEESNQLKDLFTDILRHDLLTPVQNITGYVELLLKMETDRKKKEIMEIILNSSNRMGKMVQRAAMYSKLEEAETISVELNDLRIVIQRCIEYLKAQLIYAEMEIINSLDGKYPTPVNPLIENVFTNLLTNAIKYAQQGGKIEINIDDEKDEWVINFKDWGRGVENGDKDELFTRFKRFDNKGLPGFGLGLAISKKIVDLHGGRIWVEDNPAGGSIFRVALKKEIIGQ